MPFYRAIIQANWNLKTFCRFRGLNADGEIDHLIQGTTADRAKSYRIPREHEAIDGRPIITPGPITATFKGAYRPGVFRLGKEPQRCVLLSLEQGVQGPFGALA